MKVKKIQVREFTAFENVEIEFSPGLNVFIGANATGKSHLMKLLYSIIKAAEQRPGRPSHVSPDDQLKEKLANVFMPDKGEIGRLVRRTRGRKKAIARLGLGDWAASLELTTLGRLHLEWPGPPPAKRCIFVPSRETLAMFDGFIGTYDRREISIDETYYDLCVALSAKPLRGPRRGDIASLLRPLEHILGGRVVLEGGRFHVAAADGFIEAHLLAEGFRKIAGLAHLIANGSLMQNGLLFWDEPEANLNPKLVTRVAETLRTLTRGGVQVFIATHDFLLSHELSLAAEYETPPRVPMRFFAFSRADKGPVTIESGETLAELTHNPILEEFAAHYDREHALFRQAGAAGRKPG
ncbi:MAG TPA: AAA family ATPase [Phycisphaerae bacterium]|nr:AAA family ATPase [Phycisphaerae bacterium]HRR83586.1 AAA family ATPase [Phycisphaerae bacterium]